MRLISSDDLFIENIFARADAEVVISNLFKVFDTENTGVVVPTELLIAFSMSMKGTGLQIGSSSSRL